MYQRALPTPVSGSNFPYAFKVSGTLPNFTAVNQEQTINTGLSEIKYFYIEGNPVNYASNVTCCTWIDMDETFAKQVATLNTGSTAGSTAINSGTNVDGVITATGTQIKISNISGGTVTVKTGNNAAYLHINVKWYAG